MSATESDDPSYAPWSIKRDRRSRAEVQAIRDAIKSILEADHPQTVRQVFYQLVTRGVIEKTEGEYKQTVIRLLSEMRILTPASSKATALNWMRFQAQRCAIWSASVSSGTSAHQL
jgi:hypothetical protein